MLLPSLLVVPSWKGTHVAPTAPLYGPSKLATDPLRDKADRPLTARFDEHRPKCHNKFHPACASGEHKRPTASSFVFPRSHSGSTGAYACHPIPFLMRPNLLRR